MSSLPGLTLEEYLCWDYNVVVVGRPESNFSLGLAEIIGTIPARSRLDSGTFGQVVTLFEPFREQVESRLLDFDEDTQSWRDYAGYSFDFLPDSLVEEGRQLLNDLITAARHP